MAGYPPQDTGRTAAEPGHYQTKVGRKCQDMVRGVIDAFVTAAAARAERSGGNLSVSELEQIRTDFFADTECLAGPCDQFLADVLSNNTNGRSRPFHRLIVSRFEHMLAGPSGGNAVNGELPRRFLPGFFLAMDKMLGEDRVADYERQCTDIIERLQNERGQAFSWSDVYADREANTLVIDPLVEIAVLFNNLERRAAWFVDLVNSHLGDESDRSLHRDAGDWRLTDWTLQRLLRSMFSDLDFAFRNESLRTYITERFGDRTCATVENVLDRVRRISAEDDAQTA